jgi:carboxylesterase
MGVCLLIHGFTGAPSDLGQLGDYLRDAGHTVVMPTLAGHGGSRLDLERVSWLDWIHSVEKELTALLKEHEQVHLVGFSMRNHPGGARDEDVQRYLNKVKSTPVRALVHFRRLVQTVKPLVEEIEMPLLVVQGELDDLVEARSATYIYEASRSNVKELRYYPQSRHMICVDCEAEQVMEEVVSFIGAQ